MKTTIRVNVTVKINLALVITALAPLVAALGQAIYLLR